jgi:hypothetical protein
LFVSDINDTLQQCETLCPFLDFKTSSFASSLFSRWQAGLIYGFIERDQVSEIVCCKKKKKKKKTTTTVHETRLIDRLFRRFANRSLESYKVKCALLQPVLFLLCRPTNNANKRKRVGSWRLSNTVFRESSGSDKQWM